MLTPGAEVADRGQGDPGGPQRQARQVTGPHALTVQQHGGREDQGGLEGGDEGRRARRDARGGGPEDAREVEALAQQGQHGLPRPLPPVQAGERSQRPGE